MHINVTNSLELNLFFECMDKNGFFHSKKSNMNPIFFKVTLTYGTLFSFNVIQLYTLTLKT
jgi:hypothetical protein